MRDTFYRWYCYLGIVSTWIGVTFIVIVCTLLACPTITTVSTAENVVAGHRPAAAVAAQRAARPVVQRLTACRR